MGVPKFYRWLSERYPCLSEVVREYQIPEFDNLYLDMNGIIHLCSHPNDDDPHFRITEEKIFSDIFHYIECLFRLIKPKKVFFMAVDGVAPRAKMNQQRGRRFRSAREAQESEKRATDRGEKLPEEERFDSNCITPGTEFMVKLQEQLKYFVNSKVTSDKMWQGPRIFLSGHETPGEGEHKIMDFIRYEKSLPDYDPNTRHCLYGLDADLIMLGLCTHEPHFSLLREEVRFGGKKSQKRIPTAEETTFHLLHLSLLREYLEHEFSAVKSKLPFPFDLERIVDDWVLMGFLVGNDFIPNLPNMHIVHGALPTLYQAYRDVLPTLDGYINEGGFLNLERFEKYIHRLSQVDYEHFNDSYADFKWLESRREVAASNGAAARWQSKSRGKVKTENSNPFAALENMDNDNFADDAEFVKKATNVPIGMLIDIDNEAEADEDLTDKDPDEEMDDDGEELFQLEFTHHKRDYYMNKLNYEQVTQDVLRDQAECFVRAIQWNLHYYYNGVCSWSWYYPHHYAPYISDIKDFAKLKLDFDLGKPFLPFQQLLAVLPSASKSLLPKPYQNLMCNTNSPVIDYYPANFQTDLNGKQQDWEAVVLIPFIDETRLLEAMALETGNLTNGEKIRNSHGPCLLYTYSETSLGKYPSSLPGKYPDINVNHAKCTEIPIDGFRVSPDQLCKGLCPGVRLDVYFPGFPTLKHIPHTARLKKAEVKVFQMNSRGDNMLLTIESRYDLGLRKAAEEFLGQIVYSGWPHLAEAKIDSVSNTKCRCTMNHKNEITQEDMGKDDDLIWHMESSAIEETYFKRWGVEIGETKILVHARPLIGRKYTCAFGGKVTLEKQWALRSTPFALQTIVKDIQVHDSSFAQYQTLDDLFPVDSVCFMLGTPNYGCLGKAMKVDSKKKGFVQVSFEVWPDPMDSIIRNFGNGPSDYMEGYKASQRVGISGYLFSRITTTFYVKIGNRNTSTQRANIGLNLKFNKKNEEVAGFTKKEGDKWLYSPQTVDVVNTYLMRFPEMFDYLSRHVKQDNIYTDEMLENSSSTIQEVQTFLKSLPTHSLEHQRCGSETVEESVIKQIEMAIDQFYATASSKQVMMQVRPHLLYKPSNSQGCMAPDATAQFQLFDRVVNIRDGYSVPLGLRGTIIGIQSAEKEADIVYEILLDKEIRDGLTLRCSPNRGYRLPPYSLINLSHGSRADHRNKKPTAVVHPQSSKSNGSLTFENSGFPKSPGKGRIGSKQIAYSGNPDAFHQTSKQNVQGSPQAVYPNTLNHSPNSPFVLRQPHLLTNRPQFVTPKLQTSPHQWTPRQSIASQWQVQGHEQPRDSEFQDLWKQLQSGGSTALPPQGLEFTKSNSSLLHAAKSLPKNTPPQRNAKSQQNPTNANDLPDHQRQGPPPMPAFGVRSAASNPNPSGEFNNMLQALTRQTKVSGTTVAKNDPAILIQNLQIQDPDERSANTMFQTATKAPEFGSKLTVEQLFKEARESEIKAKELASQKPNLSPRAHSSTAPDIVAKPIPTDVESSSVTILMNIVQKRSGGIPCYEYIPVQHGPSHFVRASVKLPDGTTFYGLPCANKEKAAEAAAHDALIKSQYTATTPHRGPLAALIGPPSVAHMTGAPVRLAGGMPQHISAGLMPSRMPHQALAHTIPYGAFPPGNQFYPPAQMYPRPYAVPAGPYYANPFSLDSRFQAQVRQMEYFHHQPHPQESHQDRSGQRSSQRPQNTQKTASSFEPLQVTKQKMTPKKGSSKEHGGADSANSGTNKDEASVQPGGSYPTASTRSSNEQTNSKAATAPNQRGRQKKKASRLAINFQAAGK